MTPDTEDWRDLVTWSIDISGPDEGIAYDFEHGELDNTDPGYFDEVRDTDSDGTNDTFFADITGYVVQDLDCFRAGERLPGVGVQELRTAELAAVQTLDLPPVRVPLLPIAVARDPVTVTPVKSTRKRRRWRDACTSMRVLLPGGWKNAWRVCL